MTSAAFPDEPDRTTDSEQPPAGHGDSVGSAEVGQPSEADIDARFTAIVAQLSSGLTWEGAAARLTTVEPDTDGRSAADAAAERARRRELRRAERERELADFVSEQARRAAEYEADDAHFVPADPPPVPRPRRRTVAAVALLAAAILLVARPSLIPASSDLVVALALVLLVGALALFGSALRRRSADPADGDGWDDGARL